MGYARALVSSTRYESLASTGTPAQGVTVAGAAGAYGSLVTIGTTGFDYDGFFLNINGQATRHRVTVTVNTGGADVPLIEDYFFDSTANAFFLQITPFFPVAVPKGAVLKAKVWNASGTGNLYLAITGMQGDSRMTRGFARVISATDFTGLDPTNTLTFSGTTTTGWVQAQASTTARIAGLYASLDGLGNSISLAWVRFDLGWGASGSERVLASFYPVLNSLACPGVAAPFPCDFPAGTRLAYRAQASTTDTSTLALVLCALAG